MRAWLRLLRIANLPTAIANVLAGFLLANGTWQPVLPLCLLVIASACIYSAGMVLNDVFDSDIDAQERPNRPIPAGDIPQGTALNVGRILLIVGVALAFAASWKSGLVGILLAAAVWLYDGPLKRTFVAPFLMGSCRSLNILMAGVAISTAPVLAIWYAIAIGVFITGVTWMARNEAAQEQQSSQLIFGGVLIALGLAGVATIVFCPTETPLFHAKFSKGFVILSVCMFIPIARNIVVAIVSPTSKTVQRTIISCLQSLIIFDAMVCLLIENGQPFYSIALLGLLAVSFLLKRFAALT